MQSSKHTFYRRSDRSDDPRRVKRSGYVGRIYKCILGSRISTGYTGYLTNKTVNGQIAQQEHGATIVIEHRFFGLSNPIPDLTDNSLRLLTIQQSIDDLEYFAKNVKLPMPGGDKVKPKNTPWILIGGSYSGALTAWTMTKYVLLCSPMNSPY